MKEVNRRMKRARIFPPTLNNSALYTQVLSFFYAISECNEAIYQIVNIIVVIASTTERFSKKCFEFLASSNYELMNWKNLFKSVVKQRNDGS